MIRFLRVGTLALGAGLAAALAVAQPADQQAQPPQPAASPQDAYRRLAPGVMKSVDPELEMRECSSVHDIVEVLAAHPDAEWAKEVNFRHEVWHLEFQFKPLRTIRVDMPQPSGKMQRKLIHYMVYNVTNKGGARRPTTGPDGTYQLELVDVPIRFIPEFLLEARKQNQAYPDRVIPVALGPIQQREDPNRRFLTSAEISARDIPPDGAPVWAVATWEEVDPRITHFSVYVQGLTNAYRWKDEPGEFKVGDPPGKGRLLSRKTLKINFWRPGDPHLDDSRRTIFGIPGEVDYEWVYR